MRSARSARGIARADRCAAATAGPAAEIAASSTACVALRCRSDVGDFETRIVRLSRVGAAAEGRGARPGRRSQPKRRAARRGRSGGREEPRPRPLPPRVLQARRADPDRRDAPRRWFGVVQGRSPARSSSAGGRRVARGPRSGATARPSAGHGRSDRHAPCAVHRPRGDRTPRPGGDRTDSHPVLAGRRISPNPRGTSFRSGFEPARNPAGVAALDTSAAEAPVEGLRPAPPRCACGFSGASLVRNRSPKGRSVPSFWWPRPPGYGESTLLSRSAVGGRTARLPGSPSPRFTTTRCPCSAKLLAASQPRSTASDPSTAI